MKLTLAEPKFFKDSINAISELVNEARFKITSDAIELVAMDPANVAMVIFKLLSSSFVEYEVDGSVEIAINFPNLKQIVKRTKPTDMLSISVEENRLKLTLKGTSTRTFFIPIIEIDEKEQKVPDLKFPLSIKMNTELLAESIEDADVIADSVTLSLEGGRFIIDAESDLNKSKAEMKDGISVQSETQDKVSAKYSIEYLKKMMSGSKLASEVVVRFNKDYPLMLEYKTVDKVALTYILAPRVEND